MLAGNFVMEIGSSEAIKKNDAITNFVLFCLPKAITEAAADWSQFCVRRFSFVVER